MRGNLIRAGLALGVLVSLVYAYSQTSSAPVMADAANALLAALDEQQKAKAVFAVDDDSRQFWHFVPDTNIEKEFGHPRPGLTLKEMTPEQRNLAGALLAAGLSRQGYIKARTVMSLEEVLRVIENDSGFRRDPEKYHFSIFGKPSADGVWGYRVEGHHLSLHFLVVKGELVAAPTFYGANPREVPSGPRKGLRTLPREEDLGRQLVHSLNQEQKTAAIVSDTAYPDILTETSRVASLEDQPSGLSAEKMTLAQRKILDELIAEYANNMPPEVAQHRLDQYRKAGSNLQFAWAGSTEPGGPHYYRVKAPTFLIEYDCTQNKANHIHSVWRDWKGDFGRDLLAEHYRSAHSARRVSADRRTR